MNYGIQHLLFVIFSLIVFVGCNPAIQSEKEIKEEQEKDFNPLDYSDVQFDSIGRVSVDSAILSINKMNLKKDSFFIFSYVEIAFFSQKDRFESFYLMKNTKCMTDNCYLYIATKTNEKYEILDSIDYEPRNVLDDIYLKDVNFDDKKDIVIKSFCRSVGRITFSYDLILQPDFENKIHLYADDSLYILKKQKKIIAFRDGGNFGVHEKNFYKWINDSLTLTKYWESSFDITGKKTTEKFVIQNGKSIRIDYDTTTVNEIAMDSIWYAIEE